MLAAMSGEPEIATVPFTSNTVWTAPAGVALLLTLAGSGGAGAPGSDIYSYDVEIVTTITRGSNTTTTTTYSSGNGLAPADRCEGLQGRDAQGSYTGERCYYYTRYSEQNPPITGPSATAFGYTFPGGVGAAASTLTYGNVAVTPGNPYNIVVPSGGLVTITYYK